MSLRRPLLRSLAKQPPLTRGQFDLLVLLERLVWERVNNQRYSRYTRAWKNFYRSWRREEESLEWPTSESFKLQHQTLLKAARQYGLLANPLETLSGERLVQTAEAEILAMERFTRNDLASVRPPVDEMLP